LHQEVKNLQDKLNESNVKAAMFEGKNHDVTSNYDRTQGTNSDNISRMKVEFERLSGENVDLLGKISRSSNELENARVHCDKQK